jgi:AcrR family transcriptional regulator
MTEARDGRSTRWDPHRRARRLAIINAAIAAIEEHGPDALTGQIAEKASVPRTHVYRHFEGKQALDLAVSRHVAAQIGEQIRTGLATQGSPRDIIGAAINQHLSWIEAHPNLYRFLAQHAYAVNSTGSPAVDDAKAALAGELTTVLADYMRLFGMDTTPAARVIVGVVGMVDATAAWWLEHRDVPRPELTADLTEQVWLIIDHTARSLGVTINPDSPIVQLHAVSGRTGLHNRG